METHFLHLDYSFHVAEMNRNNSNIDAHTFTTPNILQTIQSTLIFLLNAALLVVIVTRKKLRCNKSYQFFVNLQLIHMMLGIACIITNLYSLFGDHIINNALLLSMFCSLMVTTVDRFVAIKFPFRHKSLTSGGVILILSCSWVPTIIFVTIATTIGITTDRMKLIHVIMIAVAATVLAASNIMVYIVAKNHDIFIKENSICRRRKYGPHNRFLKASYVCFAIVFTFIMFWSPYCIHDLLELTETYIPSKGSVFSIAAEQISLLNSLIDPILFSYLSKHVRQELKILFRAMKCNKKEEDNDIVELVVHKQPSTHHQHRNEVQHEGR